MNTFTGSYLTRFSSGTIAALLILSSFLFLVPFAPSVHAANASPGVVSANKSWFTPSSPGSVTFTLTNPASNSYPQNEFLIILPSGWMSSASSGNCGVACTDGFSGATVTVAGNTILLTNFNNPPGGSGSVSFTLTAPSTAPTGASPDAYTFQFKTSDTSASGALVFANSLTFYVTGVSSISVATTPTTLSTLTAGQTVTITTTVNSGATGYVGLPLSYAVTGCAGYNASGLSSLPHSSTVGSSGSSQVTFFPDPVMSDYTGCGAGQPVLTVTPNVVGLSPQSTGQIKVTTPAAPSTLSISVSGNVPPAKIVEHSLTAISGSSIVITVTDQYGNPSNVATNTAFTVTAVNLVGTRAGFGSGSYGGSYPYVPSSVASTFTGSISSGSNTANLGSTNYFYDVDYGDESYMIVSAQGLSPASSSHIITYSLNTGLQSVSPSSAVSVQAGNTQKITLQLATLQANVPVYFIVNSPSTYGGRFSGNVQAKAFTDGTGKASASLTVDTTAGASGTVTVKYAYDPSTNNTAGLTAAINTIPGNPANFMILAWYNPGATQPAKSGGNAVNGTKLYLDVAVTDAYGNTASNPGPSNIQITLQATGGSLSATTLYIPQGCSDTAGIVAPVPPPPPQCTTFGLVTWTLPTSVGTTVSVTASGAFLTSASFSVTTVSPAPLLSVTSPKVLSGFIYSKTTATVFSGTANVSLGYPRTSPSVTLAKLGYKVGSGTWHSVALSGTDTAWSVGLPLSPGLNTVMFNVTDSAGNVAVSQAFTVLVDTSPPTITFVTANNAVIQAGQTVQAQIVDTLGDLNFTSVKVTYNGTTLPSSGVSISGTNNPGQSVTYTVTISGLPSGKWVVQLSASDLAGNAATPVSITVVVVVPTNQSFTVVGTPSQTTVGGFPAVQVTYQNNLPAAQQGIVFAVVHNTKGQTVLISTATITPGAGAQATAFLVLAGLAPGTYSVDLLVLTSASVTISQTTTVTVTV